MAYWITQFGSQALPTTEPTQDTGLADAALGLIELPGGGVADGDGSAPALVQLPYLLQVQAELVHTTPDSLRTALYLLRALHGIRAKLYRTPDNGALNSEWVWARLARINVRRRGDNVLTLPVTFEFLVLSHPWSGDDATVDTVLSTTPKSIVCANGGNAAVTNAIITVTARGTPITVLTVAITGISSWTWTGTLAVGESLVVDCGARTVRNDGDDDYGSFALGAAHTINDWLRLAPGNNTVVVTRTGGDATSEIEIAYADGWA